MDNSDIAIQNYQDILSKPKYEIDYDKSKVTLGLIAKLNDLHVPYEDKNAFMVASKLLDKLQPEILIIDEWLDFYQLSKFDKDPHRELELQDDIDILHGYYTLIREVLPHTRIIQVESNHDVRLKKYLNGTAKALKNLRCLTFENLLNLDHYGIEYMPYFIYGNFMFKHGHVVRGFSSYSARGEFEREGMSGASGHTHRLGSYYATKRGGSYLWLEGGCLCKLEPEYMEGQIPNWQQGIILVSFAKNDRFYGRAVPIIDHKIYHGGELYEC